MNFNLLKNQIDFGKEHNMSIAAAKQTITRTENSIDDLAIQYKEDVFIIDEFTKLKNQLRLLFGYLNNLDQLKPNYDTNQIDDHMQAIQLHVDLLKEKLNKKDFIVLQRRMQLLKKIFKFHPTRYSTFAFILAWFYEWLYFI